MGPAQRAHRRWERLIQLPLRVGEAVMGTRGYVAHEVFRGDGLLGR
jgi:hypothetical protein